MPPWSFPQGYCAGIDPLMTTWISGPNALDGDTVFCLSWSSSLWFGFLFAGVCAWVVFTLFQLLGSFEWRDLSGFVTSEILRRLARQLGALIAACASFYLLLLAHQGIYLFLDLFFHQLGPSISVPSWHTDLLWSHIYHNALTDTSSAIQFDLDHGGFDQPGGETAPGPFGLTWDQVKGTVDTLTGFVPDAVMALRFATMFVVVVTAPLAIMCKGHPLTSPLFDLWLKYWLQLEGIAVGSIAVLACYQSLDLSRVSAVNADYVRLGLLGLVTVANLAFLANVLGNFLREGAQYYTAQQQRSNAGTHGWIAVAGAGVALVLSLAGAPEIGLPLGAALAGTGGAVATAIQAQHTPGAQVGPGPSISAGAGSALTGYSRAWSGYSAAPGGSGGAWQPPTWDEAGGGGLLATANGPSAGQLNQGYVQALGGLESALGPGLGAAPPLTGYTQTGAAGDVHPGQAIASYLSAAAGQGLGLSQGAGGIRMWEPPGGGVREPYLPVGGRLVPVRAIEGALRAAPFVRDALQVHQQARLRPQDLSRVMQAVSNYYQRQGGGRAWGSYRSQDVKQAVDGYLRVRQVGARHGLISHAALAQGLIDALNKL